MWPVGKTCSIWPLVIYLMVLFVRMPKASPATTDNATSADPYIDLEKYCNSTVNLPCITNVHHTNRGYGGTVRFWTVPQLTCRVTVTANICNGSSDMRTFSLHFNIREAVLLPEDRVEVFQLSVYPTQTLLKTIHSGASHNPKRKSVSQVQTSFVNDSIAMRFDMVRSEGVAGRQHQVQIDYIVVSENAYENGVRCPALDGYVYRDLVCTESSKISCPNQYESNRYGTNPAADVDQRGCRNATIREVFRDDFVGDSINTSTWNVRNTTEDDDVQMDTVPENVGIVNGSLLMRAERVLTGATAAYRVSHISSGKGCSFLYGELEVRAKFPYTRTFPLIAMMRLIRRECQFDDTNICEAGAITLLDYRSQFPNRVDMATDNGRDVTHIYNGKADLTADFHTFKLNWSENMVVWYIDDKEIYRVDDRAFIPSVAMQFFIEVTAYPAVTNASNESAEVVIDYVVIRSDGGCLSDESMELWWIAVLLTVTVTLLVLLVILAKCIKREVRRDPFRLPLLRNVPLIPKIAIKIDKSNMADIIGRGEFGTVRRATANEIPGCECPCVVAVKEIRIYRTQANPVYKSVLSRAAAEIDAKHICSSGQIPTELDEVRLHGEIKRHLNIINLMGVMFSDGSLHVILEYAPYGSLLKYLLKHKQLMRDRDPLRNYLNEDHGYLVPVDQRDEAWPPGWPLKEDDLVNFAFQISRGMRHLALYNIIHRDLAARNVLVCDNKVVKICDFGLAKHCTEKSDYFRLSETDTTPIPARWMAPESLQFCSTKRVFSEKTDVWSFGMVMWEIFTFGETPYHDVIKEMSGHEALGRLQTLLRRGVRPAVPAGCPMNIYDIMGQCWLFDAAARPTFALLMTYLESLMGDDARSNYVHLDEPYVRFNSHIYANVDTEHPPTICLPRCL